MSRVLEILVTLKDEVTAQAKALGANVTASLEKVEPLMTGMTTAVGAGLKVLTGDYQQLGNVLGTLPGPIGAIGGAFGAFLGSAIEKTMALSNATRELQRNTGMSAEQASGLLSINEDLGISYESTASLMTKFTKALGGAMDADGAFAAGGKSLGQILKGIGIDATDAYGKVLPVGTLLPEIADKIKALGPGYESTALATKLFGKAGADLLPILLQGSDGIDRMTAKAKEMGLVLGQSAVSSTYALIQQQRDLNEQYDALGIKIGTVAIPALTMLTGGLNEYLSNVVKYGVGTDALGVAIANYAASASGAVGPTGDLTGALLNASGAADGASGAFTTLQSVFDSMPAAIHTMIDRVDAQAASMANLQRLTAANIPSMREFSEATQANVLQSQKDEIAVTKLGGSYGGAAAQVNQLKQAMSDVSGAISGSTKEMDMTARIQTELGLATGQVSLKQLETKEATKAVMTAVQDKSMSEADAVKTLKALGDGTITANQAMDKAGPSAKVARDELAKMTAIAGDASGGIKDIGTKSGIAFDALGGVAGQAGNASGAMLTAKDSAEKLAFALGNLNSKTITITTIYEDLHKCFVAGTLISTPKGDRAIETLRVGDAVQCYDTEHKTGAIAGITQLFTHTHRATWFIDAGGTLIHCTVDHPFYSPVHRTYIPAHDLIPGALLLGADGKTVMVRSSYPGDPATVYNIEVPGHHNYFAGGVLVHNASSQPQAMPANYANAAPGININQSFVDSGVLARKTAKILADSAAVAARQAMTRASIGD